MSDHILVEARLELVVECRSVVRMVGVRNASKVSELNNSVKDWAYYQSLSKKYELWSGGDVESVEKEWEKFIDV